MALDNYSLSTTNTDPDLCCGGMSFNSNLSPHSKRTFKAPESGKIIKTKVPDIYCYRCHHRMGCSNCCEPPSELICTHCNNWATKKGIKKHGNVVPNPKVPQVNTNNGWLYYRKENTGFVSIAEVLDQLIPTLEHSTRLEYLEKMLEMEAKYPGVGWKQAADELHKFYHDRKHDLHSKPSKFEII